MVKCLYITIAEVSTYGPKIKIILNPSSGREMARNNIEDSLACLSRTENLSGLISVILQGVSMQRDSLWKLIPDNMIILSLLAETAR